MLNYLTNKRSIALLLAVCFMCVCFLSSCDQKIAIQPPITDEQLRSMPLYVRNTNHTDLIHLPDMPQYYWPKLGDPEHKTYVEEYDGTEIEYYGETFTINSFCYYNSTDYLSSFYYPDEKKLIGMRLRDYASLKYDSVTKKPLEMMYFKNYEPYDISDSYIEMEDAKARIELFVEDVLNDKYEKGIDLDNYEFEMASSVGGTHYLNYYFNDVLIHTIRIHLTKDGNVQAWTCHPVPSKDVISSMPNISKEQWEALVVSTCTEQYAKMGESVVARIASADEAASPPHAELIYNAQLGGYAIQFQGRIVLEHSNGVKENKQFDFAIPIQN